RNSDGNTCRPVRYGWDLSGPGDLPIIVDFLAGETYDFWLAVRVEWKKGGEVGEVVVLQEMMDGWPESGADEWQMRLERDCLIAGCARRADGLRYCVEGACVARESPGPFDPSLIDPGAPWCEVGYMP
ncbi:MAG: hypothetical protein QME96_02620, partial [Myxococcota bacterium]|nr:hypothetical protein [Myxococcota bacterium]